MARHRKSPNDSLPEILQPLEFWGFEVVDSTGKDLKGTCPFCLEDTLHANPENGRWICSRMNHCGHQGNVASFLKQYWQFCEEHTQSSDIKLLAEWRGIPAKYLRKH
jgi:hypothetical protein